MNREIEVAFCNKRTDLRYTNRKMLWSEFVRMLQANKVTLETHAEYMKMTKDRQGEIKDVGGFVSGYLRNGSRKINDVIRKSFITLDIDDKASQQILEDIRSFTTFETVLYGTHKYTEETPRCRVLIPLMRDVNPTEYEFLAREIADELCGIDTFDPTTFQVNRMMYFPSSPKDIKPYFEEIKGDFVNPDEYLKRFPDYKDVTTWKRAKDDPVSTKKGTGVLTDPRKKDGAVGAFCTVYSPKEAIDEFLSDIYKPGVNGRYTYIPGSSSNGLRIYNDSLTVKCEDATDPANVGTSINAFDLVRIHKFSQLDDKIKPDTPINKYPSYKAMVSWCEDLEPVKEELHHRAMEELGIGQEEVASNGNVLGCTDDVSDESQLDQSRTNRTKVGPTKKKESNQAQSEDWTDKLTFVKKGKSQVTEPSSENILLILSNDPKLKGLVGKNLFDGKNTLLRKAPWTRDTVDDGWNDTDDSQLRIYLENTYKLEARQKIIDGLNSIAADNKFNPVKDFITKEKWDGVERVDTLFIDYLGAEDTEYVRTITRKTLVAAVARVFEPGTKFDYMPILVGKQGIGKSLIIQKLGDKWVQGNMPDLKLQKDSFDAVRGRWLVEMAELTCLKKDDRETIKAYITKTEDTYRKAYDRNITTSRRTCIFIGTTNDNDFLNDATGNRRFMPIQCNSEPLMHPWEMSNHEIHQIWAEAYDYYLNGEKIMDIPESIMSEAIKQQEAVSYRDDDMGIIEEWLDTPLPRFYFDMSIEERQKYLRATNEFRDELKKEHTGDDNDMILRDRVCPYEVWCECKGQELGKMPNKEAYKIGQILKQLPNWIAEEKNSKVKPYGVQRRYKRVGSKIGRAEVAS